MTADPRAAMRVLRPPFTTASAAFIAGIAHAGQLDKAGVTYLAHPAAVAQMVKGHGHPWFEMAAWLHDVVEDSAITLDDLRAAGCPEEVVKAVDSMTRRAGENYFDMVRRAARDRIGRVVKLADNAHNTAPERVAVLDRLDPDGATRRARKYAKARAILTGDAR